MSGHPLVDGSSVFPSPFPAVSRDGRGDRRWSLFRHAPLASPSPWSESRTTCSLPLAPIVGARSKGPHTLPASHPLTYPDPVARGPPPPHPRGAATPRARLTVIVLVHAPSVCRQPAYQSCRSAHVTKFLLLLPSLFTCLETWSVVCSFSFTTTLRVI